MTFDELQTLAWPDEFVVEYADGAREQLLRGKGIAFTSVADDPEGCGGLSADLPKRHPLNQDQGRYIRFPELLAIYTTDGEKLWPRG